MDKVYEHLNKTTGGALKVEDITPGLSVNLRPEILEAFKNKVSRISSVEYNDYQSDGSYIRRLGEVRFFGIQRKSEEEAVIELAKVLNKEYDNYKFHGLLSNVLYKTSDDISMALSYVLLSKEDCKSFDMKISDGNLLKGNAFDE